MGELSFHEMVGSARNTLAVLTTDQLRALPPEDLTALIVTLRQTLDKAEEARSGYGGSDEQEWERLTT